VPWSGAAHKQGAIRGSRTSHPDRRRREDYAAARRRVTTVLVAAGSNVERSRTCAGRSIRCRKLPGPALVAGYTGIRVGFGRRTSSISCGLRHLDGWSGDRASARGGGYSPAPHAPEWAPARWTDICSTAKRLTPAGPGAFLRPDSCAAPPCSERAAEVRPVRSPTLGYAPELWQASSERRIRSKPWRSAGREEPGGERRWRRSARSCRRPRLEAASVHGNNLG